MIRNVVIHVSNEQPLLADLYGVPNPADVGLVCTNVRMLDGKKPIFIDDTAATFIFPYLHLRFIEIPAAAMAGHLATGGTAPGVAVGSAANDPDQRLPVLVADARDAEQIAGIEPEPEGDLDIDEDFLQRIRDI